MNIVLTSVHITKSPDAVPLAPALLKTYLERSITDKNLKISIIEFTLEYDIDRNVEEILNSKPDIIGFSIYLWNRKYYMRLINKLKQRSPGVIIVAGGPEIRSDYQSLLEKGIDYTIDGEGEETFSELVSALLENRDCLNIDGVNDNKSRYIKNINTIPSPILTGNIDLNKYDGYLWELSRGCPFSCDFCFESRGFKGVRHYDLERVKEELKVIIESETSQVFVLDPTFNINLDRAKLILRLIKKINKGTHFHFEVRAELLDNEISRLFTETGSSLQIGIQSGHNSVLKLINRSLNRKDFTKKIALLNNNGTIFGLDLIYGLPGDDYSGFKDSMEYVLSLQPNHVDIFPLAVLPGTALYENASNLGLNYLKDAPYTVISSDTYSESDMLKSKKLKEACDLIYNKAKSTGWLKQVCVELKVSMTDFIENFISWSENIELNLDLEIETIKKYIKSRYRTKTLSLIFDIINYHYAYSTALLSEKMISKVANEKLLESIPILTPTVTIGTFNYNILDAFDYGLFTIKEIKSNFHPDKVDFIAWFHSGGEVVFDCYDKNIMKFLKSVNGVKTSLEINKSIDPLFLSFAQECGMLAFS